MAQRRKPWNQLAPATQRRYTNAGITPRMRQQGADLRTARGHAPGPRPGQAPAGSIGVPLPTEGDRLDLRVWRETVAPAWLPSREHMSDAVAASLSQLKSPRSWESVTFHPAPAGESWTMTVVYTRGYPDEIELPPDQYRDVLDLLSLVGRVEDYTGDDAAWADWAEERDFDVEGS